MSLRKRCFIRATRSRLPPRRFHTFYMTSHKASRTCVCLGQRGMVLARCSRCKRHTLNRARFPPICLNFHGNQIETFQKTRSSFLCANVLCFWFRNSPQVNPARVPQNGIDARKHRRLTALLRRLQEQPRPREHNHSAQQRGVQRGPLYVPRVPYEAGIDRIHCDARA